jgi:pimeloyl-ACP methyl ester carboxylesterase
MHVVRRGSGEPLVLLHGIGDSHLAWLPVLDALSASREVWAVDLPGFGASPCIGSQTIPGLARAVSEELGGTFDVVGNSMGGAVAFELARMGVARSVVALSPAGFYGDRGAARMERTLRAYRASARVVAPALPVLSRGAHLRRLGCWVVMDHGERMSSEVLTQYARSFAYCPGWEAMLREIVSLRVGEVRFDVPVTVAWGTRDRLLPFDPQAGRARERVVGARFVALGDAGHIPTWDVPERLVGVVLGK